MTPLDGNPYTTPELLLVGVVILCAIAFVFVPVWAMTKWWPKGKAAK